MDTVTHRRIIVCGSRHWNDSTTIATTLTELLAPYRHHRLTLVHGASRGADTIAAAWWSRHQLGPIEPHPADWASHGRAAGPIRNQHMVTLGADLAIGFLLPDSRGTRDCLTRATAAGIPTHHIQAPTPTIV